MLTCIVLGTGDVGSAVAHALFSRGHRVVLHDVANPAHPRRGMAFVDALYDGVSRLAQVLAKRARDPDDLLPMAACGRAIPVTRDALPEVLSRLGPDVLVDARMRKRHTPQPQRMLAPLTIGLGPNFVAGETTDLAIETGWGPDLGHVIHSGSPRPLAGEPQPITGVGRERYVYAPAAGILRTSCDIGERVTAGTVVATIGDVVLTAPISGCIRGLAHDGASVEARAKIIEIDPRNDPALVFGLGKRPLAIAGGVVAAIEESAAGGSTGR